MLRPLQNLGMTMRTFDIYVDSAANIPDELVKKHNITVIPYTCTVNGKERLCYEKDMVFKETATKFYAEIAAGADVKTSLVDKHRIIDAVTASAEAGRDIVMVTISSGISGTYNQAIEAKKYIEETYKDCTMYVLDGANASLGEGLQALKIADLRDLGESAESCANWHRENVYKINSYFTVADLKYLRKSGRISTTLAIAGTILNIKPILKADGSDNAKIIFHSKERGRKRAIAALAEMFKERAISPENNIVAIAHAGCEEDALALASLIKESGAKEIIIEYYDLCTVSHVGPGTLALFFYGADRKAPSAARAQKKTGNAPAAQII